MLIPAFMGEFGLKICYHVPWVHAMGRHNVVEIEEGEEALYPLARRWIVVPRAEDDTRRAPPEKLLPRERFIPNPHVTQGIPAADVVICPRKRKYGWTKNWPGWPDLERRLNERGHTTFAAGAPDSSDEVAGPKAWDYPRFLDATIQAMNAAKVVIATDAGLAHLALLCGRPLVLITHEGRVAPGPIVTFGDHVAKKEYWPVKMREYYEEPNHMNSPVIPVDGWNHPDRVIEAAESFL